MSYDHIKKSSNIVEKTVNIKRKNVFIKSESVRKENESPINRANSTPHTHCHQLLVNLSKIVLQSMQTHTYSHFSLSYTYISYFFSCVEYWHEHSHLHTYIMYGISNVYANVAYHLFLFVRYIDCTLNFLYLSLQVSIYWNVEQYMYYLELLT